VLNTKEMQLCWFENDRRTKPKGLVDLSYSYLYLVHDSLFERPFCFQLVERALPCISTHHYLCAENVDEAQVILTFSTKHSLNALISEMGSSSKTELRSTATKN